MKRRLAPLLAVAAAILLSAFGPANVRTSDPALQARVESLSRTVSSGDLASAMDVIPPRLLTAVAQKFGIAPSEVRGAVESVLAPMLDRVTIEDFGMDLDRAETRTTPDGSRTYLLLPTWTVIAVKGGNRIRSDNTTLAMQDEGEWYLIRIDADQVGLLRSAYPEFEGVDFPAGEQRVLD